MLEMFPKAEMMKKKKSTRWGGAVAAQPGPNDRGKLTGLEEDETKRLSIRYVTIRLTQHSHDI